LALHYLDRGHHALAARCFQQMLERAGGKLPPLVLFQVALACQRSGDKRTHDRAWKLLTAAAPGGVISSGKPIPLVELRKRIDASVSHQADPEGGLSRAVKDWRLPTTQESDVQAWLAQAVRQQRENGRPVLPGSFPLVIGDRLFARSQNGIVAVELATGK